MNEDNTINFDQLFEAMGIADLPAEEREKMAGQFMDAIDESVVVRLSELLSQEELSRFIDLEGDEAEKFLKERNIDLSELAIEESVRITGDWAIHVENTRKIMDEASSSQE